MKKQVLCDPLDDISKIIVTADDTKSEHNIKMVVIGESGVGKTSIVQRAKNKSDNNYKSTVYFEHSWKNYLINDTVIRIMIWDTCGQELYHSIVKHFYKECLIAMIVFAIDDINSFEKCENWLKELKENAGDDDIVIALIGNKTDLEKDRLINKEIVEQFVNKNKIDYYEEWSALTGDKVEEIFKQCVRVIYNRFIVPILNNKNSNLIDGTRTSVDLSKPNSSYKDCLCCMEK